MTPWEQKGMVMRTLVERATPTASWCWSTGSRSLHDDGWALVLPDPEEPLTHVWAEGAGDREAAAARRRSTPAGSVSSSDPPAAEVRTP